MRLDLLSTIDAKSFRWDSAEQSFEQVFEFRGHSSRNFQVSLLDVLVNVFQVFLKVGGHAHTELIQNGAETVPVHTFAVRKPLNDFRRQVGMCATERVWAEILSNIHLGQSKVSNLDVAVLSH